MSDQIFLILVYARYTKKLVYDMLWGFFVIPLVCSILEVTRNDSFHCYTWGVRLNGKCITTFSAVIGVGLDDTTKLCITNYQQLMQSTDAEDWNCIITYQQYAIMSNYFMQDFAISFKGRQRTGWMEYQQMYHGCIIQACTLMFIM